METITKYYYITSNKKILNGEPVIRNTRTPIRSIVEMWRMGIAPEEITIKLPYLSLSQIFEALSYYNDHIEEINGYIEKNWVPENLIDPLVKNKE